MVLRSQREGWSGLVSRISKAVEVDASARASGALMRKRQVRSGSDLLHLALAYGPGGQSLRETAAWAQVQGVASMSAVALLKRLRGCSAWLGELAGGLLARRVEPAAAGAASPLAGFKLRVVDGSVIGGPGRGRNVRLQAVYDVDTQRFTQLDLTPTTTGESLERIEAGPGEVVVADRGYPKAGGLRHLVDAGADYLVRVGRRSLALRNADGTEFDLTAALDESERNGSCDRSVLVADGSRSDRDPFAARLVLIRKPPEAAARARRTALRESQRGRHRNDPVSLRAAEHLMLVTSLSRERASPRQVGRMYRLRWQIELAFKRLKSLLHLDRLPAKDKALARTWILAHLIVALVIEDIIPDFRAFPPEHPTAAIPLLSIWRITKALCAAILQAILGHRYLDALLTKTKQVRKRLSEPKRKRKPHAALP